MSSFSAIVFGGVGVNCPGGAWHLPAHAHPAHELVVVMKGRQWVRLDGRAPVEARAGDVVLFAAGRAHEEGCDAADGLETFFFTFDGIDLASAPEQLHDADGRIRQLVEWMRMEQQRSGMGASPAADAFARALLAEHARLGATPPEPPLIRALRAHLRTHLAGVLTLDGLARRAGVSKYHLIRMWKRVTGRTPMEEIRFHRAVHARDLILITALPLKEIAVRAGFNDAITLNRVFRRCFGITPGSLRQSRDVGVQQMK